MRTTASIFLFLTSIFGMAQQEQLPLSDAISLTIANNPKLKKGQALINAAAARIQQSKSNYYPQLSANGNYTRIDPTGFVPFPTAQGVQNLSFIPNDNYNANVTLQMNLFDFGRTATGVKIAENGEQISETSLQLKKQELALKTIQVFYQIHFLQQAILVQQKQLDALQLTLKQTKELKDNGEATNFELLTTEVKIASAENKMSDLMTSLDIAFIQMEQLTGAQNLKYKEFVNDWLEVKQPDSLSTEHSIDNRPEYKLAKLQEETAALQEKLARKNYNPYLFANVQGGYKNAIQPNINELKLNYVAVAQLTIPIFSGFKNKYMLQEAKANKEAARFETQDTEVNINAEIAQTLENLKNSFDKIARSQLQVEQARRATEIAQKKYKNGLLTNLDLLDFENSLAEAEINQLNVIFAYTLNSFQLKKAMGISLY
ncbi:TolC family protein [Kaistella flava (ex Peng et al. 2021)]|uniref:TolC family protein n=1 Tax=Kaistella flava (ex Peng et al. 2021) TaxID=2038776 RepID=A0A7M2YEL0_9FLAO|nr:TolC family protein [Kaistella flava (ex Peng et al. 2021)]QOW11843.1 TolC family protein [Kaistella flava (ex Peng et al. 2021)]